MKLLTYPAPHRASVETGYAPGHKRSTYSTRMWTKEDVLFALSAGAFFIKGRHDFADVSAAKAAGVKSDELLPSAP